MEKENLTPDMADEKPQKPKRKRNVLLFISAILGVLYTIYIIVYFSSASGSSSDATEAIGIGIATALATPHMIATALATIFNILGWAMNHRGFALTGAILYCVAAVCFPMYAFFVVIQIVLSFIGFAKLKKMKNLEDTVE